MRQMKEQILASAEVLYARKDMMRSIHPSDDSQFPSTTIPESVDNQTDDIETTRLTPDELRRLIGLGYGVDADQSENIDAYIKALIEVSVENIFKKRSERLKNRLLGQDDRDQDEDDAMMMMGKMIMITAPVRALVGKAHGIHTNLILVGLEDPGRLPIACILSILIVLMQCIALRTIIEESTNSRCEEHSDCKTGEYCGLDPDVCDDCFWPEYALQKENIQLGQDTEHYLVGAAVHCNTTDTMPTRCDHLVQNLDNLTSAGYFMLAFSAGIALLPQLRALDQGSDEYTVVAARGALTPLYHVSNKLRRYLVPALVIGALSSLILSDKFTSLNFLVDSLVIGFMSSIDDLLALLVINKARRIRCETILLRVSMEKSKRNVTWSTNRSIIYCSFLDIIIAVVFCEWLIKIYGEHADASGEGVHRAPCSDVVHVIVKFPLIIMYWGAIMSASGNERNKSCWAVAREAVAGLVILWVGKELVGEIVLWLHLGRLREMEME